MNPLSEETIDAAARACACRIRRASVADAAELAAFAIRTFTDTYGRHNRPDDLCVHLASSFSVPQQTRELCDPAGATLLAHDDDRLAGYAQVRRSRVPSCVAGDRPVELHRFYVDRPWHGGGVSQTLFAAACKAALGLGGATVWLKVWERNPRAIAFYAKAGFVDVGTADFFVGSDRQTDRVLELSLHADTGLEKRPARPLPRAEPNSG